MGQIKKIIVFRPGPMGKVILANPALAAIRQIFTKATIHLFVDEEFYELVQGNKNIDEFILFSKNGNHKTHRDKYKFIKALRAAEYDLAIDLDGGALTAWLSFLSKAPRRIGRPGGLRSKICYNLYGEKSEPGDHNWKEQFFAISGIEPDLPENPKFSISVSEEDSVAVKEKLNSFGMTFDRKTVLLLPGARVREQKWPIEKTGILARWLVDEKEVAVVLAGAGSGVNEIERIRKSSGYALPFLDEFSLSELTALIDLADLVICNDSGPMHIAGVLNRPTVAIFGPTDPNVWAPVGSDKVVLTPAPMECMPCDTEQECPHRSDYCVSRIELGEVQRAVNRIGVI